MRVLWLPQVLRDAGLKVAVQPGADGRGREFGASPLGVIAHHTAGPETGEAPSLRIVTYGRSDLPGPLSQLVLGRSGTYYYVASGRANHAGAGYWKGMTNGNAQMIGIEAEASGRSSWPAVQMDAYRRGVAAILKKLGRSSDWVCGHKEYARPIGRKPDPNFDMNAFRNSVAQIMAGGMTPITPTPAPIQEFNVPFSPLPQPAGHILADYSGLMLTGQGQGKPVITTIGRGVLEQRWVLHNNGDGSLSIRTADGKLALDAATGAEGQELILWPVHGGAEQRWIRREVAPFAFQLLHQATGRAANVWDSGVAAGASVRLWVPGNGVHQTFRHVPTI